MGEKLGVSKTASTREATITKEPVTGVKVQVTHEEMIMKEDQQVKQ